MCYCAQATPDHSLSFDSTVLGQICLPKGKQSSSYDSAPALRYTSGTRQPGGRATSVLGHEISGH